MAAGEFYAVGAEGGPGGLAGERLVDQALGFGVEGGGVAFDFDGSLDLIAKGLIEFRV